MIRYLSSAAIDYEIHLVGNAKLEVLAESIISDKDTCAENSSPIKSPSLILIAPIIAESNILFLLRIVMHLIGFCLICFVTLYIF